MSAKLPDARMVPDETGKLVMVRRALWTQEQTEYVVRKLNADLKESHAHLAAERDDIARRFGDAPDIPDLIDPENP